MKKNVKKAGAWLAVALIIGLLTVPAMAATGDQLPWGEIIPYDSPAYLYFTDDLHQATTGNYVGTLWCASVELATAGTYVVDGVGLTADEWIGEEPIIVAYITINNETSEILTYEVDFGTPIVVPDGCAAVVFAQSLDVRPTIYEYIDDPEPVGGFYYTVRELLQFYFYGDAELAPEHVLTLNCLSTAAVLAIVVMPFVLVYFVIKLISGR